MYILNVRTWPQHTSTTKMFPANGGTRPAAAIELLVEQQQAGNRGERHSTTVLLPDYIAMHISHAMHSPPIGGLYAPQGVSMHHRGSLCTTGGGGGGGSIGAVTPITTLHTPDSPLEYFNTVTPSPPFYCVSLYNKELLHSNHPQGVYMLHGKDTSFSRQ